MKIDINKLEIRLFKIYILFLPMTLFHPLKLNVYFKAIGDSSSFFMHIVGLLIILINVFKSKKIRANKLMIYIACMIMILNFTSILMSLILNYKLGTLYGENTYNAVIGDLAYYTQIIFIFYYNYYLGNKIEKKYISKMFLIITIFQLFIGCIQVLILNGIEFLTHVHKVLENIGIVYDINDMVRVGKIYLTGGEASSVANIIGFIVLPYLLSNIIINKKNIYTILLLMYVPIIYFSKSTTVYIAVAVQIIVFALIVIKKIKIKINKKSNLMIISIILLIIGGVILNNKKNDKFIQEAKYYFVGKLSDKNNLSTIFRESTVKNNIEVFKKYPIIGSGNGLQGYYYEDNLEPYAYKSEEVRTVLKGYSGVPSGGSFFTSYISGYGLLGILLLVIFVYKANKSICKDNELYYIYILGGINFLILSLMALGIAGNYLAIFIVSIPLFNTKEIGE